MNKEETLKLFKENEAILEGHFLLTSGLHSNQYLQCALVLRDPVVAEALCQELALKVPQQDIDFVIGPALGGVTLSYEMARQLNTKALFAERDNGKMTLRRGFQIKSGDRVLVAEDVITTGGSVKEVIEVVKRLGGEVVGAVSLVDRSNGKVDLGCPYYSLLSMEVVSYRPEDCPLCKKGLPVVKPGSRQATPKL